MNTEEYVVYVEKSQLKQGEKFIGVICNVDYQTGSKVAFRAIPYTRPKKTIAIKVIVPDKDEEKFIEAIEKIDIEGKYNAVKDKPIYKEYMNKSKFTYSQFTYKNFKDVSKMAGDEVMVILSQNNWTECFYVAPKDSVPSADGEYIIKNEAVTIYHYLYKYYCSLYNLLDAIDKL